MNETMFGGRKRGKRSWGASGKQMVFGIYQRNGKVLTFTISRAGETLIPLITHHTKPAVSITLMICLLTLFFLSEEIM